MLCRAKLGSWLTAVLAILSVVKVMDARGLPAALFDRSEASVNSYWDCTYLTLGEANVCNE